MNCVNETTSMRPPAEEVVPGVWSIRQPLQNAMRYVWAYALEVEEGVLLVDAGLDDDVHLANLESALALFGAALEDVHGAIFTHFHRDHYGLAERIRRRSGAWLALHETEARFIASLAGVPVERERVDTWFRKLGAGGEVLDELVELVVGIGTRDRASALPDRMLSDGVEFEAAGERFEIMHTPGHSPGHVCIVDRRRGVVFSGDHVLSHTTPNVGIYAGTDGSPLGDYLRSLERVRPLAGLFDLPGHEQRIEVEDRAAELIAYHGDQLDQVVAFVADGCETVWEIAGRLWPEAWDRLPTIDRHLALGEAYAHIAVLVDGARLKLVGEEPLRWQAPAA
jgi:glyoxylase-like metal-dependent hydrolase (beta-lactamase superfamily II)